MKAVLLVLFTSLGMLFFSSCSKKDCVCVTTNTENGVVTTSSSTSSGGSGIPGPAGAAGNSELCNSGDYMSSYTSGGVTYVDKTECELE